jgi:hypothetical protein
MCLEILDLKDRLWRLCGTAQDAPRRLARIHARLPEFYRVSFGPTGMGKPSEHIVLGLQKAKCQKAIGRKDNE